MAGISFDDIPMAKPGGTAVNWDQQGTANVGYAGSGQGKRSLSFDDIPMVQQAAPAAPAQPTGVSTGGAGLMGFTDTLSAGFADELTGAIGGVMEGLGRPEGFWGAYERVRDNTRAMQAAVEGESPNAYLAGQVAGGIAQSVVPVGRIAQGASMMQKVKSGAKAGAALAGAYGVGSGTDLESRAMGGLQEGAKGAALGGAFAPVAAGVGAASRGFGNMLQNPGSRRAISRAAGRKLGKGGINRVMRAYKDDFELGGGKQRQPEIGEGDMLMNLGPQLEQQATGAIARQPGRGQNIVTGAIKAQRGGSDARVRNIVDQTLGKDKGRLALRKAQKAEAKLRGKLFEIAKANQQPIYIGRIRQVLDDAIAASDGKIRKVLEGLDDLRIFQDPKGGTPLYQSAEAVHAARQEVDQLISESLGTPLSNVLRSVRKELDDSLKAIPGWKEADQKWSELQDAIKALNKEGPSVFDSGRRAPQPDELMEMKNTMQPLAWEAMVQAARNDIARMMGQARNDAAEVYGKLATRDWNREKLAIMFGKQNANKLMTFLEREVARQKAGNDAIAQSITSRSTQAQKEFPNAVGNEEWFGQIGQKNLVGGVLELGARGLNKAMGGILAQRRAAISEDAATLLTASGNNLPLVVNALQRAVWKNGMNSFMGRKAEQLLQRVLVGSQVPVTVSGQ